MKRSRAIVLLMAGFLAGVIASACGDSHPANASPPASNEEGGLSPPTFGSLGDAATGDGAGEDAACVATEAQAKRATRPVDIIVVIDNSLSMSEEIAAVESSLNASLASILEAEKVDYRVIMLSSHGGNAQQKVCVKSPLSGTSCNPVPAMPAETARFFHHSVAVGSNDALCVILNAWDTADQFNLHPNGFGPLLRDPAFKVFVIVSDDRVGTACKGRSFDDLSTAGGGVGAAQNYEVFLTNLHSAQLGSTSQRNYIFHSIVGLNDFDALDLKKAWPVTAPISVTKCATAFDTGTGYQALSVQTGGLRFPTCGLDYTPIFTAVAGSAIGGVALDCEILLPTPPAGQTLDLTTVVPRFQPSVPGAQAVEFVQVGGGPACVGDDKFYIEAGAIKLCPQTCARVQGDSGRAQLKILYGCQPKNTTK